MPLERVWMLRLLPAFSMSKNAWIIPMTVPRNPIMGAPVAMVAIATSIVVEVLWVAFMDSVLFGRRRMERELAAED